MNFQFPISNFPSFAKASLGEQFQVRKTVNCSRLLRGYTLMELIVVMGVLTITVGAMTIFLTSVLKGTNKANVSAEVKQNGQAVLDSLERQIRGASSAREIGIDQNHIKLNRSLAEALHVRCEPENFSRNSRISLQVSDLDDPPDSNYISLSNDDPNSGISIENCVLEVIRSGVSDSGVASPPIVYISFTAEKVSTRADLSASSRFETTISLRQY